MEMIKWKNNYHRSMNRIRSNELLNIIVRPGGEGFITLDELGIVAQKGKPI